ncbi:MAG: septation protein IspZ [Fibrobacterota bacterium]
MDKRLFIKNLLIGFIPLLVFVAADHFFTARYGETKGMQYALITAVGLGIAQFLFILARERRVDAMTLFDTGLLVTLGAVSWLSGNDLFFKLKPALIEFILVVILGVAAFLNPRLLLHATGRFMQGVEVRDHHLKSMQRSAAGMFVLFLLHTALIVYAALFLSKAAWAFISGGLFYILAGGYFLVVLVATRIKRRRMMKAADVPYEVRKHRIKRG